MIYQHRPDLEMLLMDGVPEEVAEVYLEALEAKLEQIGSDIRRFDGWTLEELCGFFGLRAGVAAYSLIITQDDLRS